MPVVLETARLVLREMTPGDLDFVAEMLGDSQVMRFYPRTYSRHEAQAWIGRQLDRYERDGHGLWIVVERATGLLVGQIGLVNQQVNGATEPEVGYLVHRAYWRRGIASEAAAGTRDYAFDTLGKTRVVSLIRPDNFPSLGVARRIGMRPAGETLHAGSDHLVFALKRDERPSSGGSA